MIPRPSFARKAVAWLLIYAMSLPALPALASPIAAEVPADAVQTATAQPQVVLATGFAIKAVGSAWAVTATVTDASSQPLADASVHFSVSSGPDAGTAADVVTDPSGHARLTLSASAAGVDVVQASITDDGGTVVKATPLSLQWTAAQGCPVPPEGAPAPAQLAYLGPTSAEYGDSFDSAALLTDSLGAPLAAKSIVYTLGTVSGSAVTDANGLARIAIAPLAVGSLVLHLSFAGDASAGDAAADQTVDVAHDETLLELGGRSALATGVAQQVSATLFDGVDHAPAPLAGKTITFTVNGASASAVTGADGVASATITIPASGSGGATLEARFAGDEHYLPSSARATTALYVPSGFIIWGGNPAPLTVGQRVNFWGSQWDKQVLGGQYDTNAGFKGYSSTRPNVSLCQTNATPATLTPSCWIDKDGQSSPPETLPPFIGVAVATAVVKGGSDVYGNVAAVVVVRVEPGYGADPGKPGFGTIVAVADGGGRVPRPQLAVAQQQPQSVLPGEAFDVVTGITNQGSALAHGIHVDAAFDGSTPATGAAAVADLAPHVQAAATFHETTAAPSVRAVSETVGAYQLRLATLDGARLSSVSTVTYGGANGEPYLPVHATSSSIVRLPRLFASIAAPSCVTPSQRVTYNVTVTNLGSATAVAPALAVTFPDGTTATAAPGDIAAGAGKVVPLTWSVPAVPAKAAEETDADYRARLAALDGTTLTFRVGTTWSDSRGGGYGDVVAGQSAVERLPILETVLATDETALPATLLSVRASTVNRGTGNAIQTDVAVRNPDGTTVAVAPFTLEAGATAERTIPWQIPAVAPKGSGETDAAYRARLAASDNVALKLQSTTAWTDANDSRYGPVGANAQTLEVLPVLGVALSAPAEVLSGQTIQYTAVVNNDGHAPAATASLVATLPDGSAQTLAVPAAALAAGGNAPVTFSYAVPETHPNGSDSASVALLWSDANANAYGPLTAAATTKVIRPNEAPVVNAGPDQSVRLPNSVTLNGSATDDNRPNGTLAVSWTQVIGPGTVVFGTPNAAVTTAAFSAPGDYVLRLSADDGQLSASDDAAVHVSTATLTLTPAAAGPNVTGTTQTMTATLLEGGAPLAGQPVQFVIAGANAQTLAATTNAAGVASITYTGTANGSDTIVASNGAGSLLVQSGASHVDWVTPVQKVSTTTVRGRFFTAPNNGAFTATPTMTPVFEQFFPTINFNPPSGTVPGNTSGVNELTRPMYNVTTDLNGNFTGTILARGNGATLGTNFMTNFNAVFTGTFTVATAGNITFNFYSDDGFIFGIGNGATRVSGALFNPPTSMRTPFENFPVMGAYNTATAPVANSVTVNFPAPGSYPYELDYSECCAGQLAITMTTSTPSGNRGVPPTGSLVISPNSVANPPVGATLNLTITATDASGLSLANLPLTLTVSGANAQVLSGVTGSDGRAAFSYVGANPGGDTLQATAAIGATIAYSNMVFVTRGTNQTPVVNAGPDQTITLPVNQVTLSGSYTDDGAPANGNVLYTWSLASGPSGSTIANPNALATAATFTVAGTYTFRLTVSDGAASGNDTMVVAVNPDPNANKAPVVNAGPDVSITLPATASLNGTVTDDGKPAGAVVAISWSRVSGPGTVTFAPPNAAVSTASFSAAGTYVLRLTANDTQLSASDDVTVVVAAANVAPTVNAGPDRSIGLPTTSVTLSGSVTDDGKLQPVQTTWTVVSGPAAVTFSPANAAVTTATFTSTVGTYTLRLSAYDGQYTSTDDVVVTVTPANKAPVVNAGPDQAITRPLFATMAGTVTDDGIPAGAVITTTWSKVSGPGTVAFSNAGSLTTQVSFSASGIYTLRLTANDTQLTASDDVAITVNDPPPPPTVSIAAPLDGATLTAPASITGSVSGGDWKLEHALRTDDSDAALSWTTFATGSGPATNLGSLDPSLLLNGTYAIRLSSTDIYFQTSRVTISVAVQGDLKLGNFSVSYTDIEVPSPGLPLQVMRTYDTRDKRVGDFGFGWSLGLRNVRVQKNGVLGSGWEQVSSGGPFPRYCAQPFRPHYVTITFPDGRVYKFAPSLSPSCQSLAPLEESSVVWTQVATGRGTEGASLIAVGADDDVFLAGSVPGPIDLLDMSTVDIYNPTVFRLTTAEGYEYFIDQKLGATQITDPSGFALTISSSGITHSDGKRVAFVRDGAGRITSITDPNGKSIVYTYNAAGDLVSVKDRENNTTTFTYDTTHRLLTIVDPLGRQPVRNDYDAAGRLIQQTDANHQVTTYVPDL
ncbi:MAG TPA: Ig-like domain-containing protein, partial [Thermoanaerobaculia bacterium]|nr:Ig-like domain-containing protein [Thermoanaerobaculia bacterium]